MPTESVHLNAPEIHLGAVSRTRLTAFWNHLTLGGYYWRLYHHTGGGAGVYLEGAKVELRPEKLFDINPVYWEYIVTHLQEEGLIEGLKVSTYIDGSVALSTGIQITPKGIAYIFDNNLMAKAKKIVNKAIEIAPLVL